MLRHVRALVLAMLGLLLAVAGGVTSPVGAQAVLTGSLSGTVRAPGGAPIADVLVTIYSDRGAGNWQPVAQTTTDAAGSFTLADIPDGYYRLGFDPSDDHVAEFYYDAPTIQEANSTHVHGGYATVGYRITLDVAGHVTGRVTAAVGGDLADVVVAAYKWSPSRQSWDLAESTSTATDGSYHLGGLPTGTYRLGFHPRTAPYPHEYWDDVLTISEASDVTVVGGQITRDKDAVLGTAPVATPPPVTPTPTPAPLPTQVPAPVVPVADPAIGISEILSDVKVSGKLAVGKTLTVKNLLASFRGTVSYEVRWHAGESVIKKATKPKLKLTRGLRGKVISVKIKATSAGVTKTKTIKVGKVKG